jgi:uncharacterized repeat protein (TIGR01451 family)
MLTIIISLMVSLALTVSWATVRRGDVAIADPSPSYGSDGYFSTLADGALPVIEKDNETSSIVQDGWENTRRIMFGKQGSTGTYDNASVSGGYKTLAKGPVESVADASPFIGDDAHMKSATTRVDTHEVLLWADDETTAYFMFDDTSGTYFNTFDNDIDPYQSNLAKVSDAVGVQNYSSLEQFLVSDRAVEGVCTAAHIVGCGTGSFEQQSNSKNTYKAFPLSIGDVNRFVGTTTGNLSVDLNLACPIDIVSGWYACANGTSGTWLRTAVWDASEYAYFVKDDGDLQSGQIQRTDLGLRPALRLQLDDLLLSAKDDFTQPAAADTTSSLTLTAVDSDMTPLSDVSIGGRTVAEDDAISFKPGTTASIADSDTTYPDGFGWKIIDPAATDGTVAKSGTGDLDTTGLSVGDYDTYIWGLDKGSTTEGITNHATEPRHFTLSLEPDTFEFTVKPANVNEMLVVPTNGHTSSTDYSLPYSWNVERWDEVASKWVQIDCNSALNSVATLQTCSSKTYVGQSRQGTNVGPQLGKPSDWGVAQGDEVKLRLVLANTGSRVGWLRAFATTQIYNHAQHQTAPMITSVGDIPFIGIKSDSDPTKTGDKVGYNMFGRANNLVSVGSILHEDDEDWASIIEVGDDFLSGTFARTDSLEQFADGSFNTTNIESTGDNFFASTFLNALSLTELPEDSFILDSIETVGDAFFSGTFSGAQALTELPDGSFSTSSITTAGDFFFYWFAYAAESLESLPDDAFNTENLDTVGTYFFADAFSGFDEATAPKLSRADLLKVVASWHVDQSALQSTTTAFSGTFQYVSTASGKLLVAQAPQLAADPGTARNTFTDTELCTDSPYYAEWGLTQCPPSLAVNKSVPTVTEVNATTSKAQWDVTVSNTGAAAASTVTLVDRTWLGNIVGTPSATVGGTPLVPTSTSGVGFSTSTYDLTSVLPSGILAGDSSITVRITAQYTRQAADTVAANQAWASATAPDLSTIGRTTAPNPPLIPKANAALQQAQGIENTTGNGTTADAITQCTADNSAATAVDVDGQPEVWVDADTTPSDACDQVAAVIPAVKQPAISLDKLKTTVTCHTPIQVNYGECRVEWDVTITNTGNSVLDNVVVSDRMSNAVHDVVDPSPTPRATLVATSPFDYHTLAIIDGVVKGFGRDNRGQAGNDAGTTSYLGYPIPVDTTAWGTRTITQLAAGRVHSAALASDGTVYAWGDHNFGQIGDGSAMNTTARGIPVAVSALSNIKQISAGADHNLALAGNGTVWAWGSDSYGQLGDDAAIANKNVPVQVDASAWSGKTIVQVAAGGTHSLALASDGSVYAWGRDNNGQLGQGGAIPGSDAATPVLVNGSVWGNAHPIQVVAGLEFSTALMADGAVWSWGADESGQLGNDVALAASSSPVLVDGSIWGGRNIERLHAGAQYVIAQTSDGALFQWGYGKSSGYMGGNGTGVDHPTPVAVDMTSASSALRGKTVYQVSTGYMGVMVIADGASFYSWGSSSYSVYLLGSTQARPAAVNVGATVLQPSNSVSPSNVKTGFTDRVYQLGSTLYPKVSITMHFTGYVDQHATDSTVVGNQAWVSTTQTPKADPGAPLLPAASAVNVNGIIGNANCNTDATSQDPEDQCDQVPALIRTKALYGETTLDKSNASVTGCTESNTTDCTVEWDVKVTNSGNKALTDVEVTDRVSDKVSNVTVTSPRRFIREMWANTKVMAIDANGYLWWDARSYQANGSPNNFKPVPDESGTGQLGNIVYMSCSYTTYYAVDKDGYVWVWGDNTYGLFGNGTTDTTITTLPQRVKDSSGNGYLSDIVTVEIGYSSNAVAVAVDKYGHVWTWGTEGQYGMLGIGTTNTVALLPVQVKDSSGTGYLSNIIQAEPNERHYGQAVAALAADGTV